MNENRPAVALIYFKNSWNPECSRSLQKGFVRMLEHEHFASFIVDCETGTSGEKTQKYYAVKYQPTFLFLSDGVDVKRVIGSDLKELEKQVKRVKLFRNKIQWALGVQPGKDIWENYHEQWLAEWRMFDEQDSWEGEGFILLDRN